MEQFGGSKTYNTFCQNVIWLRTQSGLSKKAMARCLGIGVGSIRKIERLIMPPRLRVDVLFAIYDRFGIAPSILLSRRLDEPQPGDRG